MKRLAACANRASYPAKASVCVRSSDWENTSKAIFWGANDIALVYSRVGPAEPCRSSKLWPFLNPRPAFRTFEPSYNVHYPD